MRKKKKKTYCWCCHQNEFDIAVKWNKDLETRRKYFFSLIKNCRFWVIVKLQDYFIQHCCVNQILLSASMEERDSKIQAIFQGEIKGNLEYRYFNILLKNHLIGNACIEASSDSLKILIPWGLVIIVRLVVRLLLIIFSV